MKSDECFVIMPFGTKQAVDGSGTTYDFDKVYRVLIQRAIRESGMIPVRADERVTSALIHSDMFRDLRDRAVVLADLSLDNPNVFYELGIRHVMSANGTVLIARSGSVLPFDVKLSRVVFYAFDGASFDWEEVERVVNHLKVALQEARKGLPDSPVYALLESVIREPAPTLQRRAVSGRAEDTPDAEPLSAYQELLASCWRETHKPLSTLIEPHRNTLFGIRTLAYLVLAVDPLSESARQLANQLNDGAQYRLANRLYSGLYEAGMLTRGSQLAYSSSYSEEHGTTTGAERAIELVMEVVGALEQEYASEQESVEAATEYGAAHRRLAGLAQWKWQLTNHPADLDRAITSFAEAIRHTQKARDLGGRSLAGFLAQSRFKHLLLLRIRDQDVERPDVEGHRDAIIALEARSADDPKGLSYLGWFQAIALADLGAGDEAQRKALITFAEDTKLKMQPDCWEIGRRQYMLLRRFLEQFGPYLQNPTMMGRISQVLQAGDMRN
jgi:hypothetical protein